MKKLTSFLILLSFIFCFSCSEEPIHKHFSISGENYLEISVNGNTFNNDDSLVSSGRSSGETCDEKPGALVFIGQIGTSEFYFELYLKHYYDLSDFEIAKTGTFKVGDIISPLCNFDAVAEFQDSKESSVFTSLKSGGTNKITRIFETYIPPEDEVLYGIKGKKYGIEGEFSAVFINQSGEDIEVTGIYEAFIYFLD